MENKSKWEEVEWKISKLLCENTDKETVLNIARFT